MITDQIRIAFNFDAIIDNALQIIWDSVTIRFDVVLVRFNSIPHMFLLSFLFLTETIDHFLVLIHLFEKALYNDIAFFVLFFNLLFIA